MLFEGDDKAYREWVAAHPESFVVNMRFNAVRRQVA